MGISFTNMLLLQLVSLAILALASQAHSLKLKKDVPVFVKTLKELHRGPPQRTMTRADTAEEKWITQPLDHFDESNTKTYEMV